MRAFLQRLLIASQWGASLVLAAGCSSSINGGNGGGGNGGSTSSSTVTGTAPGNLDPTPEGACYGPSYDAGDFGYHGQCCDVVLCAAPTNGVCLSPDDVRPTLAGLPPGSGECECKDLRGPFANANASAAEVCCYLVGSIGCDGRPLVVQGEARLAEVLAGPSAWSRAPEPPAGRDDARAALAAAIADLDAAALPPALRQRLACRWADRARFEHASVASFSRFALALMALGAPPALVAAAHRAALDEVDHARLGLAIASAYAGEPLAFGPLRVDGAFDHLASLDAAAVETVIEGCVGETLAALEAAETARQAGPRAVRRALETIAEDEARHAELGWAFVRWALGMGDARLAARVAAAFEGAMKVALADMESDAGAAEHGFLPAAEIAALRRRAVAEVIRPAAAALGALPADPRAAVSATA